MKVFVGYATANGSTRGIAERIAQGLRRHSLEVDLLPMDAGVRVSGYDAVVLGSAIHAGSWLPEGHQLVEREAASLRARPVWLFSVSTLGDEESMFRPHVSDRMRRMRKETPELAQFREWIGPQEHRNFAGAIRRSDWPATGRAFFRARGGHYGDHRNWAAIDAWTDQIARSLTEEGGATRRLHAVGAGRPVLPE